MTDIQTLIHLNIEIEGLLHVLANRDNDHARRLLGEKYAAYKPLIEKILANEPVVAPADAEPLAGVAEILTHDEVKDEEAVENEEVDETDLASAAIERGEEEGLNTPAEVEEEVEEAEEETTKESENEVVSEPAVESTPVVAPADKVRVEQAISRLGARDLRRAFTLNDKFRFRRYLFDNDDVRFAETLDTLSSMPHYAEARHYLIDNLGWDANNDDVKDFLTIVENHFA